MSPRAILVAGAGYTGDRLAARLAAEGHRVALLSRSPADIAGVTAVAMDLDAETENAALSAWAAGDETDLAYLVPPAADEGDGDARLVRLLGALTRAPARVVLASTSGVYGDRGGAVTDETVPVDPQTRRAKLRVRLEETLARRRAGSSVVLRIAGIYGPGRLPLEAIRRGEPVIDPAEAGPGNRIHVDDLVSAFVAALSHPAPPGIVNVADGDHASSSAFALATAELAGLPAPQFVSRAEAQQRFSAARLSFLNESRRLDVARLEGELGVALAFPDHRAGIRASLADG